jgi:LCP family protein required for cell wall assembly
MHLAIDEVRVGTAQKALMVSDIYVKPQGGVASWMVGMSMALTFGVVTLMYFLMQGFISTSEAQIASLIEEVGTLNQENLELSEQIDSQATVLKFIAQDFSILEKSLAIADGDLGGFEEMMLEIVDGNESVQLASAPTEDDTFDVLILGNNGSHTDTIMVASVYEPEKKVTLFSIPRDLYVNGRRINEYYHYYGVEQMKKMVGAVTGLAIDNYIQVDLQAFIDTVDAVGGIDVYVDEAITDYYYPNATGGYETYSIEVGHYHMDGGTALKYARSRKSTSDFDRAERQQKILHAVRTKLLQMDTIMDMKTLTGLLKTTLENVNTDLEIFDIVSCYYDYGNYDLHTGFVLSNGNYLYSTLSAVSGAYMLLPNGGNFEEIKNVISELVH